MSPLSFDSSILGAPYDRVMSFSVRYIAERTADVVVFSQRHVLLANGTHEPLGDAQMLSFSVNPEDIANVVIALRHPSTGVLLGANMTLEQLFVGNSSMIRQKQLEAEAAANAPAAPVEPVDPEAV